MEKVLQRAVSYTQPPPANGIINETLSCFDVAELLRIMAHVVAGRRLKTTFRF